jgi:hypothetical protein
MKRFRSAGGDGMEVNMSKEPSAMIPVIMSLGALVLVGIQLGIHGLAPERDEGAVVHLWQVLMVAQLPVIGFFAFRWLRRAPWQAGTVLVVQALSWATAVMPVRLLGW